MTVSRFTKKHVLAAFKIVFTLLLISCQSAVFAQVSLPKVFGNQMVLQRGLPIPIWGTSKPGAQISVEMNGKRVSTKSGQDGKWMVKLPKMNAGGPHLMAIYEGNNTKATVIYSDILIGDVWVASGQSNMEWQVQQANHAAEEVKNAKYPNIRFFNVPHDIQAKPQDTLKGGKWVIMDTAGVKDVSAVAYFLAKDLQATLNVPIGILQSTWGGTPVEAWTSREQLLSTTITKDKVLKNDLLNQSDFVQDSLDLVRFWEIIYQPQNQTDLTIPQSNYNDIAWQQVNMPSTLKDMNLPSFEGMVWLRKKVMLPNPMVGKGLSIHLNRPEMNYTLYFNGKEIAKNVWNASATHDYKIPADLVKQNENVITVRMAFLWSGGGFNPPAENMYITDGSAKVSLAGDWKLKTDLEPKLPKIKNFQEYPTYLYNGMINPIVSYGIKGFIWYQGENNASAAKAYRTLFPLMISDWRSRWKQGDLPFLYVQLANYMKRQPEPTESDWAALREAQTITLKLPNTGMASAIDIGEADDIHPRNKQEVGRRLALQAKKIVYNQPVQASGPMYLNHKINGNHVIVSFKETGNGLKVSGSGPLNGFAIAGADKKFYWATAKIEGNTVILNAEQIKNPVAVRYGWADNPEGNLINAEGLPAVSFRTDGE